MLYDRNWRNLQSAIQSKEPASEELIFWLILSLTELTNRVKALQ